MTGIQKYNKALQIYDDKPTGFFATIFNKINSWFKKITGRTSSEQAVISVAQLHIELRNLFENDSSLFRAFEKYNQEIITLSTDIDNIKKQLNEKININQINESESKLIDLSRKNENNINPSEIILKKLIESRFEELKNILQADIQKQINQSEKEKQRIEKLINESKVLFEDYHNEFKIQSQLTAENVSNIIIKIKSLDNLIENYKKENKDKVNYLQIQSQLTSENVSNIMIKIKSLDNLIENNKKENDDNFNYLKIQDSENFILLLIKMQEYDFRKLVFIFQSLLCYLLLNFVIFEFRVLRPVLNNILILNSIISIIILIIIRIKQKSLINAK